jgi:apolipoprotein N-acyltransferase
VLRLADAPDTRGMPGPVIRLVQPNVGQRDKWAPENLQPIFANLVELTGTPAPQPPAIVIWPEVAVTFLFDTSPDAIAIATGALPPGATLAVGAVRAEPATPRARYFNSLQFYDHEGRPIGTYDKRTLTPFGEYVPYAWLLRPLGFGTIGDGLSGFTPGTEPGPFTLPGLPPAAVLICYEIIFPGLTRRTAAGADWIIQVTNDSWFGDSFGPRQHLAQARVRAIETGLPVARAANTGISAMIDPYGRIVGQLALGQRGVVDATLPARLSPTPHARLGDAPPLAALFLLAAILLGRTRRPTL